MLYKIRCFKLNLNFRILFSLCLLTLSIPAFADLFEDRVNAILNGNYSELSGFDRENQENFFKGLPNVNRFHVVRSFFEEIQNNNDVAVVAMLRKEPTLVHWNATFPGMYQLELWKVICNSIENRPYGIRENRVKIDWRRMSYLIAENSPLKDRALLFSVFGTRGAWKEHVQAAFDRKVDINAKDFDEIFFDYRDPEIKEMLRTYAYSQQGEPPAIPAVIPAAAGSLPKEAAKKAQEMKEKENPECSICFETIEENTVQYSTCAHAFHKDCIRNWIKINPTCPMCKSDQRELLSQP